MSSPAFGYLIFVLLIALWSSPAAADDTLTAYQVLEEYDFPVGLLPKSVLSYELDSSTGKFKVLLNGTCSFSISGYSLKYKSTITGVIKKDKLTSLKGISVKVLILWLNIVEVIREGDEIEFSVGIASADFTVDNFEESPQCGCGFDCVSGEQGGIKSSLDRLVSTYVV
ncbi:hypothetical protein NMG60_11013805 [Bertholletia excelsa]